MEVIFDANGTGATHLVRAAGNDDSGKKKRILI